MASKHLRMQSAGLLIGFGIQFLAGMILNLFVQLPDSHPGATGNEYFVRSAHSLGWALTGGGGWVLAVHAYIALGLVLGSLSLFVHSLMARSRRWSWVSGVAFLFTLGAFFNGLSFVDYNHDASSMIMSGCWLIAVGSLTFGLIKSSDR